MVTLLSNTIVNTFIMLASATFSEYLIGVSCFDEDTIALRQPTQILLHEPVVTNYTAQN